MKWTKNRQSFRILGKGLLPIVYVCTKISISVLNYVVVIFIFSFSRFFSPKKFLGGEKSEQHSKLLIAAASNEVKILNAAGFQFKLDQFVKNAFLNVLETFRIQFGLY